MSIKNNFPTNQQMFRYLNHLEQQLNTYYLDLKEHLTDDEMSFKDEYTFDLIETMIYSKGIDDIHEIFKDVLKSIKYLSTIITYANAELKTLLLDEKVEAEFDEVDG